MLSILSALWRRVTASGNATEAVEVEQPAVDYNGYRIRPTPYPSGGQYQTAGLIEKDFAEGPKQYRFVRAETHPSSADAAAFAIAKGKQIINEQGDRVFELSR
jgi:hypothetical protein